MNDDAERAAGKRTPQAFRSLASQAGLTIRELGDLVEAHGRDVATRMAVRRAEQRKRGRQMLYWRRRLLEHIANTP
jgi:Protein of unknown function (DUF3225)